MASPNQTRLPKQQLSNSDHTMHPILTPGNSAAAESACEGVQGNNETIPAPITHASDIETNSLEQYQGEPILDDSHPTVIDMAVRPIDQQQQFTRENDAVLPVLETENSSSKLASDDGEGPDPDDAEISLSSDDENHTDCDDSNSFDADQPEADITDDMFEPIHPASEENTDHVPENGTASGLVEEEGQVGGQQNLQGIGFLNPDFGQETSIMDNMLNYGDIESLLDGLVVQNYPETVSEAGTWDDDEARIAEAIRGFEADQAITDRAGSPAPTSSSHRDGDTSGFVTGAVAESDNDEAVQTSPLISHHSNGDNTGALATASTGSKQGDGGNRASTTFASPSPDHGGVEHSSLATPALTFSDNSADGNSEPVTARPRSCDEGHSSP